MYVVVDKHYRTLCYSVAKSASDAVGFALSIGHAGAVRAIYLECFSYD